MPDSMTAHPGPGAPDHFADAARTTAEVARGTPAVVQGARWFWWIAGLSLLNVAAFASHANLSFSLGLAFTQLAHAVFQSNAGVAYAIDAFFIGGFFLIGQQALRGRAWAFVLGAGIYLCDALVDLKFGVALPVVFHLVALGFILRGYSALNLALKAARVR
jgi:hypothetical protein